MTKKCGLEFKTMKKNHCVRDIFEHRFELQSLELCPNNISPSQWFSMQRSVLVYYNPGIMKFSQNHWMPSVTEL